MEGLHAEDQSAEGDSEMGYNNQDASYKPLYKRRRVEDEISVTESDSEVGEDDDDDEEEGREEEEVEEEGEEEDDDESSTELEDNITYQDWLEEAKEINEELWNAKFQKYVNEGTSEEQAKDKADRKTMWTVKRNFFNKYKDFLSSYLHVKDDRTHEEVLDDLEDKVEKGIGVNKALNRVITKHQAKFEGLFHDDDEDEDSDDKSED